MKDNFAKKFRVMAWKLIGALIMDREQGVKEPKISLGRVILIISFILSVTMWRHDKEIPQTLLTVLMLAMGYVLGSKIVDSGKDWIATKSAPMSMNLNGVMNLATNAASGKKPEPQPLPADAEPPKMPVA